MSQSIIADVVVESGANEWWGNLVVTNIRYADGSAVTANQFLGVVFLSPYATADASVNVLLAPWQAVDPVVTTEQIDPNTYKVTAKIGLQSPHTFGSGDNIKFGIAGNLTTTPDIWTESFELYADTLPSGTVKITAQAAPDSALSGATQTVSLTVGGRTAKLQLAPGETKSFDIPTGTYSVSVGELATEDQTVVANASASSSQVTIAVGQTADLTVSYGAANKYSGLDVDIGQLPSAINVEEVQISVTDSSGQPLVDDFFSSANKSTQLRRLPASGTAVVSAGITLNNVQYSARKQVSLSNSIIQVPISEADISSQDIDTSGFVKLPIVVSSTTGTRVRAGQTIPFRLQSTSSALGYAQAIDVSSNGTYEFPVPVAPGEYTVGASNFLQGSVVYAIQAPERLTVASDGSSKLELTARRGADLNVRGFPEFLSFGAISDLADLEGEDLTNANVSAVFKYAGNDGAGDPGTYLADDPATTKTIQLAATVESKIGGGHTVLPIMISYTCNLSLGAVKDQLANGTQHAHSFANLILSLRLAKQHGKPDVPCAYIVNADFLGEVQKHDFPPTYSMPVREPLETALAHHNVSVAVPDAITDTLQGYVTAVNWLFRAVAPEVVFAWQLNLWGVGSAVWVYSRDADVTPAAQAQSTADYIKSIGTYGGEWSPDFVAVDRYEADDFTERGYRNSYNYGPYEWDRFYRFCEALSLELQMPVAPWQIPASRIPSADETVTSLEGDHWGSGGTYLFGDPAIGSTKDINEAILDIKCTTLVPHETVGDLLKAAEPFDLSGPKYLDFPLRGIFIVLLGGGTTTGVLSTIGKTGPWTQEKVSSYMEAPIAF